MFRFIVARRAKLLLNNVQIIKSSNKIDDETVFHNYSPQEPCFEENSNDLNENIINILDESINSFISNRKNEEAACYYQDLFNISDPLPLKDT